jgi:hypothetical protein
MSTQPPQAYTDSAWNIGIQFNTGFASTMDEFGMSLGRFVAGPFNVFNAFTGVSRQYIAGKGAEWIGPAGGAISFTLIAAVLVFALVVIGRGAAGVAKLG